MDELYIIPERENYKFSLLLAEKYNAHFVFQDFADPEVLDDVQLQNSILNGYLEFTGAPIWNTVRGSRHDLAVTSKDKHIRAIADKRVHQAVNIANLIGAYSVLFYAHGMPLCKHTSCADAWLKANTSHWEGVLKKYSKVTVFMENAPGSSPELLAALAANLNTTGRFLVSLNYTAALASGIPIENWFAALAPYMGMLQINDTDFKSCEPLSIGDGEVPWQEYNDLVKKYKYKGKLLLNIQGVEKQKRSIRYMADKKLYPFV